jgi:hypothetical protein
MKYITRLVLKSENDIASRVSLKDYNIKYIKRVTLLLVVLEFHYGLRILYYKFHWIKKIIISQ